MEQVAPGAYVADLIASGDGAVINLFQGAAATRAAVASALSHLDDAIFIMFRGLRAFFGEGRGPVSARSRQASRSARSSMISWRSAVVFATRSALARFSDSFSER